MPYTSNALRQTPFDFAFIAHSSALFVDGECFMCPLSKSKTILQRQFNIGEFGHFSPPLLSGRSTKTHPQTNGDAQKWPSVGGTVCQQHRVSERGIHVWRSTEQRWTDVKEPSRCGSEISNEEFSAIGPCSFRIDATNSISHSRLDSSGRIGR